MRSNSLMLPSPTRRTGSKGGKKRRRAYIPKGSKVDKTLSSSCETVFRTKKGKLFKRLTPHGKFIRNQMELQNNANIFTGETLNDMQVGIRIGYNQALGEQASFFNGRKKKKAAKKKSK